MFSGRIYKLKLVDYGWYWPSFKINFVSVRRMLRGNNTGYSLFYAGLQKV